MRIIHATDEMRAMALKQLADLQLSNEVSGPKNVEKRKWYAVTRGSGNVGKTTMYSPIMTYKPGSPTDTFIKSSEEDPFMSSEESRIQLAVAMSLTSVQKDNYDDKNEEGLALAQALSLSADEYKEDVRVEHQTLETDQNDTLDEWQEYLCIQLPSDRERIQEGG